MIRSVPQNIAAAKGKKTKRCLSCGTAKGLGRRRYCSLECRQKLSYALDLRTGLLRALNTRYATFYFTKTTIIMDILPHGSKEIFSFIYPRSNGQKPVQDYRRMSNLLGNEWWAEKKRTHKHYRATQHLFSQAARNGFATGSVIPFENKIPSIKGAALTHLRLGKSDLDSPELEKKIKSAYRVQAKRHHPDLGGDTATFRKIHQAYKDLMGWVERPLFLRRRGFPDKWFYDGYANRWVQPKPYMRA